MSRLLAGSEPAAKHSGHLAVASPGLEAPFGLLSPPPPPPPPVTGMR